MTTLQKNVVHLSSSYYILNCKDYLSFRCKITHYMNTMYCVSHKYLCCLFYFTFVIHTSITYSALGSTGLSPYSAVALAEWDPFAYATVTIFQMVLSVLFLTFAVLLFVLAFIFIYSSFFCILMLLYSY